MKHSPAEVACRIAFGLADGAAVTLWLEGKAVRYRAPGPLSPALEGIIRSHPLMMGVLLTAYPGGRREPGADNPTATEQSESLLASLPEPLREHERGKWCADLSRLWGHGASGREAARQAHAALAARIDESERGRP